MSEMKHTPGPWSCFYKPKYDEWHVSLPMANCGMKLALAPDGIQSENREADAHLIGAAPEMLAALQECQSALAMMVSPNSIEQTTVANAFAAATAADVKARAAIAKAEGRHP